MAILALIPILWVLGAISITLYGVVSAFQEHVLMGIISLIPPCGFIEGAGMLFHYNIAHALIAFLSANGAHF